MTTTTIRLPEALKARVSRAAKRMGTTSHGFILAAISEKAAQAEERAEFIATAEQRLADFVATGKSVPWSEVRQYIQLRAAGKKAAWPKARTFRPS